MSEPIGVMLAIGELSMFIAILILFGLFVWTGLHEIFYNDDDV